MFDFRVVRLESENLLVDVLPANGGKVASISDRAGTEFLLAGADYGRVAEYSPSAAFATSDCAGLDECLPTLATSGPETLGGSSPDHGDFWRIPWQVVRQSKHSVSLEARGVSRPIHFRREISLSLKTITTRYRLLNEGSVEFPFHYACHPLFSVDPGDRIVLPPSEHSLHVYGSKGRLRENEVNWPRIHDDGGLDVVGSATDDIADMLFTRRLREGVCGLYRHRHAKTLIVRFDVEKLPFLGVWLSFGGWPDDAMKKQFAVALEPTTAPCGSLSEACTAGLAPTLLPGVPFEFQISFIVVDTHNYFSATRAVQAIA